MSKMRSNIFNDYVKIAQEKGIVPSSNNSKKILEETGRADSLDADAIAALYGVKPNTSKGMEYERNIVEVAHPNSVVISPSYDKINGLFENVNERQNITINILNKTRSVSLTNHKYAQQELLLSLIRIANDLDNNDQDQLRILADACINQTAKLKKQGYAWLIAAGIAALFATVYAYEHLGNSDEGYKNNYNNLVKTLSSMLDSKVEWGFGREYDDELRNDIKGFLDRLSSINEKYNSVYQVLRNIEVPRDYNDMMKELNDPNTKASVDAYQEFKNISFQMLTYIDTMEDNFKSYSFKHQHIKDEGIGSELLEKLHLSGGLSSLFADPFQDVLNAIAPFKASLTEIIAKLKKAEEVGKDMAIC